VPLAETAVAEDVGDRPGVILRVDDHKPALYLRVAILDKQTPPLAAGVYSVALGQRGALLFVGHLVEVAHLLLQLQIAQVGPEVHEHP